MNDGPITSIPEMLDHIEVLQSIEDRFEEGSEDQKFWAEIIVGAYDYLAELKG